MPLPQLPADKANHVLYGALAFVVVAAASAGIGHTPHHARIAGALAAALLGTAKEAYDAWRNRQARRAGLWPRHEVSGADVLATSLGGLLGWLATITAGG